MNVSRFHLSDFPEIDAMASKGRKTDEEKIADWNSGFMYKKDFQESKMFQRYCLKLETAASVFMSAAVESVPPRTAPEPLPVLLRSFFKTMFSEDDIQEEGLPDNCVDWRFNLIPLTHFAAWNMKEADEEVLRGWQMALHDREMFSELYARGLMTASVQFLHCMYIRKEGVEPDNFCIRAVPENSNENMLFVKLLMNVIWVQAYCAFVWSQQERAKDKAVSELAAEAVKMLRNENEALQEQLDAMNNETVPEYKKKIREMRKQLNAEAERRADDFRRKAAEELAAERKKNRQLQSELDSLRKNYEELDEELKIMNEAESDTEEHRPESELTYDSKIVFIVSPPENGRIERTLEKLQQRLPNSRFVHHADDVSVGADCYVMLTKYIQHHSLYNGTRDMLSRRGWPYIHSSNQSVERILDDIFMKNRYRGC